MFSPHHDLVLKLQTEATKQFTWYRTGIFLDNAEMLQSGILSSYMQLFLVVWWHSCWQKGQRKLVINKQQPVLCYTEHWKTLLAMVDSVYSRVKSQNCLEYSNCDISSLVHIQIENTWPTVLRNHQCKDPPPPLSNVFSSTDSLRLSLHSCGVPLAGCCHIEQLK